jgi:hypothetical protein
MSGTDKGAVYQLCRDNTPITGATVTGTDSPATFSGPFTAEGTYTAKTVAGVFCPVEMDGSPTVTVLKSPDLPELSHDGPKCSGEYITFTASGSSEHYTWYGDVSGTGATKYSSTDAGPKSVTVQSYAEYPNSVICYSMPVSASPSIMPRANANEAKNSCGCATGLIECSGICKKSCKPAATGCIMTYAAYQSHSKHMNSSEVQTYYFDTGMSWNNVYLLPATTSSVTRCDNSDCSKTESVAKTLDADRIYSWVCKP